MNAGLPDTPAGSGAEAPCQVCGASPARPAKFVSHRGMVIMWSQSTQRATLCKDCGLALFRHVQNRNLAFGWWGIMSVFVNLYALISNLVNWRKLRGLAEPMRNADKPPLAPGRPLLLRPGAWVTAAALVLLGLVVVAGIGADDLKTFSAEDRALIGTCVEHVGEHKSGPADCSGAHTGKIVSLTHSRRGCPSAQVTIRLRDDAYLCVDPKQ